jgi:predicted ATP-grasp superfamily ATP-dependent carboligase
MEEINELWERPAAESTFMVAGWQQWADAGAISSGLPQYLIRHTQARKIGHIRSQGFYLFQIPGMHHLLRPRVKLAEGYRKRLTSRRNEFFYTGDDRKGLVIFLGEEPHLNVAGYAEAFFDAAEELGIQRVVALGGVHGPVPYDRDRHVSCIYSLRDMKAELERYAVEFSNYQGGVSITTYLVDTAARRGIEYLAFYALVPYYDLRQLSVRFAAIQLEKDFRAWYDLANRFNYMFGLDLDLSELHGQGQALVDMVNQQISALESKVPQLDIRAHVRKITQGFEETSFLPLGDVWEKGLEDLFEE